VFDNFVPYAWVHQLEEAQQWAHRAQDQAAIADESRAILSDDLNAAQLRTARALAETQRVRSELHALQATRTVRYSASLRTLYTRLRRVFSYLSD
jgi:hypothetical protein